MVTVSGATLTAIGGYALNLSGGTGERLISGIKGTGVFLGIRVANAGTSGAIIRSTELSGIGAGNAISVTGTSGPVEIAVAKLEGIANTDVSISGGTGSRDIINVVSSGRITVIGGSSASIAGDPRAAIDNSGIDVRDVAGPVRIDGTKTVRSGTSDGITITGGNSSRTISNVTSNGRIYVNGGSSATIIGDPTAVIYNPGIQVWSVAGPVRIEGTKTAGNGSGSGIYVNGGTGITISSLEIERTSNGIFVSGTSGTVDIAVAKIRGVEGNGIYVSGTPSVITIDGTTIDTANIGLSIDSNAGTRRLTVSGTTIRNLRSTGIVIVNSLNK